MESFSRFLSSFEYFRGDKVNVIKPFATSVVFRSIAFPTRTPEDNKSGKKKESSRQRTLRSDVC